MEFRSYSYPGRSAGELNWFFSRARLRYEGFSTCLQMLDASLMLALALAPSGFRIVVAHRRLLKGILIVAVTMPISTIF